jgi:DNA-binding CsgD family transcriptional regulator
MKSKLSSLTSREREVVELLTNGESNRELAQRLGVSPRTIQKHLQRIYAKLGVKRRMAAVMLAVRWNAHGDSASKSPRRTENGQ